MVKNDFNIEINSFNGSFDLFFNLVKSKKINILEINLLSIIDDYILFLDKNINSIDIDYLSSYLFIASYLLQIKSRLLIPKEVINFNDIDEINIDNDNEENQQLKEKLLEYKKIKDISNYFGLRKVNADKLLSKNYSKINLENSKNENYNVDLNLLIKSFHKIAKNFNETKIEPTIKFKNENLYPENFEKIVIDKMQNILGKKTLLENLVKLVGASLENIICIFLAILNLAKNNKIYLSQENNDIFIELIGF